LLSSVQRAQRSGGEEKERKKKKKRKKESAVKHKSAYRYVGRPNKIVFQSKADHPVCVFGYGRYDFDLDP